MNDTTADARKMYNEFPFGVFCYGDQRSGYYPLLHEFLETADKQGRLADIGCGNGFWMDTYLKHGFTRQQILGIDLAPSSVSHVTERGFEAICGDVLDLKIPDNSFATAVCAGVIHHTPDPRRAFRELVRVTAPGGRIYLAVYNKWHPYFYVVHRATAPLRHVYWHYSRGLANAVYPLWWVIVQLGGRVIVGRPVEEQTCRTLFMDQVMTPYAYLLSRKDLHDYAESQGCSVRKTGYVLRGLMIEAIIQVGAKSTQHE